LRILAASNSRITAITKNEIHWDFSHEDVRTKLVARRYPSSDLGILYQVLGKEEYAPVVPILRQRCERSNVIRIMDVGANVGYTTLYFKALFPAAEILSLEIERSNFDQLKTNISLNQMQDVEPLEMALWIRNANLEIKTDFRDKTECSYYVEESANTADIKGYELGYFMELKKWPYLDFLKMDIEGAERYFFETDELTDSVLSKTAILVIEIHDEFLIRKKIYAHLERNSFQYFDHGDITIAFRNL
jgi:FkbM family methyltransferase